MFTVLDNLLRDELGVRVAFEALAEAGRFLGEVPGARQGEGVLGECEETREGEPERVRVRRNPNPNPNPGLLPRPRGC